jgi:polyphosphate kinase
MQRNLERRVENTVPVLEQDIKGIIIEKILKTYLKDNSKARILGADGVYERLVPNEGKELLSAQEYFMQNKF